MKTNPHETSLQQKNPFLFECKIGLLAILGLIVVFLILFHKSLIPNLVIFSNDVSLAVSNAKAGAWNLELSGRWWDLIWLGYGQPPSAITVSVLFGSLLNPVTIYKWYAPFSLCFLGFCGWLYARRQSIPPFLSFVFALALALNSCWFGASCWGQGAKTIAVGAMMIALLFLEWGREKKSWLAYGCAGGAVGLLVLEGQDFGAICSLYVALFALFQSLTAPEQAWKRLTKGSARIFLMVCCAVFVSYGVTSLLFNTQVKGIKGFGEQPQTKEEKIQKWNWATQWSLPKAETIRLIIPGFFGYRMDTPNGGNYWGTVGRSAEWETKKEGFPRFNGGGFYAGIFVILTIIWTILAVSLDKKSTEKNPLRPEETPQSLFSKEEKMHIWFWFGVFLVSLLIAYGKHAPFYWFVYQLPYLSTIRNPDKFFAPGCLSLSIVFCYGLKGISRRYLAHLKNGVKPTTFKKNLNSSNEKSKFGASGYLEYIWVRLSIIILSLAVIFFFGTFFYQNSLTNYLKVEGFEGVSRLMVKHAIKETFVFCLFLIVGLILFFILTKSKWHSKQKWSGILFSIFVLIDMGRANLPWIQHFDYKKTYANNAVIDKLKQQSYLQRVSVMLVRNIPIFNQWHQGQFFYHNIQFLEHTQLPRVPEEFAAYVGSLESNLARFFELTSTRYLLGSKQMIEELNQQLDPALRRFLPSMWFGFIQDQNGEVQLTTQNDDFALIEFNGALPKAKLYSKWRSLDRDKILETLPTLEFNPQQEVLIDSQEGIGNGEEGNIDQPPVNYLSYDPKKFVLSVQTDKPAILLVNDQYDPNWQVSVDGQKAKLLRCNYSMRGVQLPAGTKEVVMEFKPPFNGFIISTIGLTIWLALMGLWFLKVAKSDR